MAQRRPYLEQAKASGLTSHDQAQHEVVQTAALKVSFVLHVACTTTCGKC